MDGGVGVVTGKGGWRGVIEDAGGGDVDAVSAGDVASAQVSVRLDDGRRVLVPADALTRRGDGSYFLPLDADALAERELRADAQIGDTLMLPPLPPNLRGAAGAPPQPAATSDGVERIVIPVVAETARVEKRQVVRGGVRIRKTVQEYEETFDEPLVREDVSVERVAVDRVVAGPVPVRHEGDTMIVPVLEEVLVVEKRLVLKEELRVTRRRVETREPQTVTLRREDVVVERFTAHDDVVTARPDGSAEHVNTAETEG